MSNPLRSLVLGGALGLLAVPSCDLSVPDLNNPGLESLENNPTAAGANAAATGMLVSIRGNKATAVGYVNQLGILGRESYDFDPNDARFVTEDLDGTLSRGSPFGGSFWGASYANIRGGNIILHALDKLPAFNNPATADSDKAAMRGFVETMQAMEFLSVVLTHYDTGGPVDVDRDLSAPLGPFVSKADMIMKINALLDQGQMDLMNGGDAFTFPVSGLDGFDTPKTFIGVNRAIKARAAVYTVDHSQADYAGALTALAASFLNDVPTSMGFDLNAGMFYSFSTNPGDTTNNLFSRKSVLAHPALQTDAQKQADGMTLDARYVAKIKTLSKPVASTNDPTLSSPITFNIYTAAGSSVTAVNNEELILLKAEAMWFTGDHTGAVTELNIVRTGSGKLPALDPATITDNTAFTTALLYERRYSLMYQGGYRWIDLRRFFGNSILVDDVAPSMHAANVRFPVPQQECDARPGEPACNIVSTDPIKN
jgi:starch-binding outer membrane protein, SusD/RagB family